MRVQLESEKDKANPDGQLGVAYVSDERSKESISDEVVLCSEETVVSHPIQIGQERSSKSRALLHDAPMHK